MLSEDPAENRVSLISALNDKSKWPPGFKWNYSHPKCCAMCIGEHIFNSRALKLILGSDDEEYFKVFFDADVHLRCSYDNVTPERVANLLATIHYRK